MWIVYHAMSTSLLVTVVLATLLRTSTAGDIPMSDVMKSIDGLTNRTNEVMSLITDAEINMEKIQSFSNMIEEKINNLKLDVAPTEQEKKDITQLKDDLEAIKGKLSIVTVTETQLENMKTLINNLSAQMNGTITPVDLTPEQRTIIAGQITILEEKKGNLSTVTVNPAQVKAIQDSIDQVITELKKDLGSKDNRNTIKTEIPRLIAALKSKVNSALKLISDLKGKLKTMQESITKVRVALNINQSPTGSLAEKNGRRIIDGCRWWLDLEVFLGHEQQSMCYDAWKNYSNGTVLTCLEKYVMFPATRMHHVFFVAIHVSTRITGLFGAVTCSVYDNIVDLFNPKK